jgi:hypothetical protein
MKAKKQMENMRNSALRLIMIIALGIWFDSVVGMDGAGQLKEIFGKVGVTEISPGIDERSWEAAWNNAENHSDGKHFNLTPDQAGKRTGKAKLGADETAFLDSAKTILSRLKGIHSGPTNTKYRRSALKINIDDSLGYRGETKTTFNKVEVTYETTHSGKTLSKIIAIWPVS